MRIAVPLANGRLATHFGHCEAMAIVDVNDRKEITERAELTPPEHAPGLLPRWLAEQGVDTIIAGGMGMRAQNLFAQQSIQVVTGAGAEAPDVLVRSYLDGTLETGPNACDH